MDNDVKESIEDIEEQLVEVDRRIAYNEGKYIALETANAALSLKIAALSDWIGRVNLAFVKELGK